ncbi:NAD(P)-dependent alcohol dehydrogenase [Pedobacter antarcticus]|uniref:zinc-dependent alcohol dehydrogenase family protein n=1 Tax=Pedobacter antarcticus TaxID=34086 RepID=UPI002930917E|nr:NAD(P)-dependent alcohol dehydrogenase [Pedobacter antarcticus]
MTNSTMKAWRLHDFNLNQLTQDDIPVPSPGTSELLIRVAAVSLNFRDKAIIDGYYDPELLRKGPLTLVGDTVGTVVQTGTEVTRFKVGERITSHLYSQWLDGTPRPIESKFIFGGPLPGGLAEYMIVPENAAVLAPPHLTDEEASTLSIAGLTAWFALTNFGTINSGDTVLVQGTGGVSIFAIQFANAMGAKVIVTTSSDKKGERAIQLGASHIINYVKTPDWEKEVLKLTKNKGVDQVLEVVGGENSINKSIQAARVEGLITIIGFLENEKAKISLLPLIFKQTRIQGTAVGHRKAFEEMNKFLEYHQIRPVIDTVYTFDNAPTAFRHLSKGAFGKIVIKINTL